MGCLQARGGCLRRDWCGEKRGRDAAGFARTYTLCPRRGAGNQTRVLLACAPSAVGCALVVLTIIRGRKGVGEPPSFYVCVLIRERQVAPLFLFAPAGKTRPKMPGLLGSSQQDANVAATLGIIAPGFHVLGVADGLSVEKDRSADSSLF